MNQITKPVSSFFFSLRISLLLNSDGDLGWIKHLTIWSLSLGSTERRGITLWGEHPLRRRVAVSVLPDRRGGKINRCLLYLSSGEICCSASSPASSAVWMMNKPLLGVTVFVFVSVCVCVFVITVSTENDLTPHKRFLIVGVLTVA